MESNSRLKAHRIDRAHSYFAVQPNSSALFPSTQIYKPLRPGWQQNVGRDEKTAASLCVTQRTLSWATCQSMNTINVPMNTRHRFNVWCFNWIEVKRERGRPFHWPLSMGPCLEHSLMNDPGVRGWSGQPCLTPGHISPWGHLASFEITCQKTASIWQEFFSIRIKWEKKISHDK